MSERPASADRPTLALTLPAVPGYDILAELGRGGMGVVYKARQLALGRLVALKLIRDPALAGPAERARFRIETQAAARMRHPHIIEVYEAGEHDGRPFFAMELVEGGSLENHLTGKPQTASDAASLVRTLAEAVEHAHSQNVIHRDLKPANVLLAPAPKITDFGLAKRLDSESTALTQEGAVLGTASYMAPEQAAGHAHDVGPQADVYALGAILYECLTGQPPFQAESWAKVIEQVIHDEPIPPTRRQPDVPIALEAVCLKCLQKDPAGRYATAGALAEELGRFLTGVAVAAVPLTPVERFARLLAREGYTIIAEIGRGPRSTVYHASHGSLGQNVAVKAFTPGLLTREAWEAQLRRGIEMQAGISHPQVVTVQHGGWCDDAPYLVVEHIPNGSLADRLAGRPFALDEALRLTEQLAHIVGYLHRQGVVHANLKPSNVLFAAGDIPRLTDLRPTSGLGLAPLLAEEAEAFGLGYLAPELVAEASAVPRFHADVYGLGLILYELLTSRPPFAAPSAQAALEDVRCKEPRPLTELNAAVPLPVQSFCLRCLAKNPWRRFARVYDVAMILGRFRQEAEPAAREPTRSRRGPTRRTRSEDSGR
jgi:serine/threonine protein kinase